MYLAWCVNLGLVSESVLLEQERLVLRVRMQDALGSELLVALGGELKGEHLNERGRHFTSSYYADFLNDFRTTFEGKSYDVKDSWDNYQKIATVLTAKLLGPKDKPMASPLFTGFRGWWRKFWH